jgi:hypothetical protein
MDEDALDLLIGRLINDLSISFPATQFPATATAVGQLRLTYEREIRTKQFLKRAGLSLLEHQSDRFFDFPITVRPTDAETSS